ncbi:MAG: hypothetical protein M1606_00930 [Candidatus Thermoplasmatota archaeon]|nr:hypothetical protein [Candidatus Thermoplasmatota archaeon]MCL5983214.1 hypothetical protein [Candidatus Thermoplasmatota archaeon]
MNPELGRALDRLPSGDRVRSLVELAVEDDDPALTAAVVRRLLAEVRREKSAASAGRDLVPAGADGRPEGGDADGSGDRDL